MNTLRPFVLPLCDPARRAFCIMGEFVKLSYDTKREEAPSSAPLLGFKISVQQTHIYIIYPTFRKKSILPLAFFLICGILLI